MSKLSASKPYPCFSSGFSLSQSVLLVMFQFLGMYPFIWVCLKIGYIPNYSHLIGIMIINHWVQGYTIFRQTHLTVLETKIVEKISRISPGAIPFSPRTPPAVHLGVCLHLAVGPCDVPQRGRCQGGRAGLGEVTSFSNRSFSQSDSHQAD